MPTIARPKVKPVKTMIPTITLSLDMLTVCNGKSSMHVTSMVCIVLGVGSGLKPNPCKTLPLPPSHLSSARPSLHLPVLVAHTVYVRAIISSVLHDSPATRSSLLPRKILLGFDPKLSVNLPIPVSSKLNLSTTFASPVQSALQNALTVSCAAFTALNIHTTTKLRSICSVQALYV